MSDTNDSHWLYYKIYAGALAGKMDHLITGALQQISRIEELIRWFFLHYTDEGGVHLRLRLQTAGEVAILRRAVDPILNKALAELPALPPTPYRPTILLPALSSAAYTPKPDRFDGIRVELGRYEPDVESFGERGVALAEDLFYASSKAALHILADEREQRYSRKTVAPLLMKAIGDAFMPGAGRTIWTDYATYWLDWSPQFGDEWRPRFVAKANELRMQGVSVLAPDEQLPREAIQLVCAWRSSTAAAANAFRTVGDQPARRSYDLMFHFLHSMNNRLGLMPIEESYFATLIAESIGEESAT
jgi:thiopeptide-type bacteriocin biosynthesis protein